jgi:Tfp pilus assembly protein PilF
MFQRLLQQLGHGVQSTPTARKQSEGDSDPAPPATPNPERRRGRGLQAFWRPLAGAARSRPWTTAIALVVLLAGAGVAGLYAYAAFRWNAALEALKADRIDEARSDLAVCLYLWPDSVRVHLMTARAARLSGDFPAAETHLNQCLKLGGDKADVQLENLLLRVQIGDEDVVAPDLMAYVEQKHPERFLILETLARAYMDKLRYGPAYAVLTRWVAEAPDQTRPLEWRGWIQERMDQPDKAAEDYQHALQLEPKLLSVHLRLADLALQKSDPTAAAPYLEHLDRRDLDRPDVKALLGRCRYQQGKTVEARRLLEAAVKELPDDPPLLVALGRLNLQEGRAAEAETYLRQALDQDSTDAEARYTLISALNYQGRKEEAAAAQKQYDQDQTLLRQAEVQFHDEAVHPSNDPDVLYNIGSLFLRGHQGRIGEYWLQKALEIDPWHKPTLKALAEYYESKGDKEQAEPYRRQLAEAAKH